MYFTQPGKICYIIMSSFMYPHNDGGEGVCVCVCVGIFISNYYFFNLFSLIVHLFIYMANLYWISNLLEVSIWYKFHWEIWCMASRVRRMNKAGFPASYRDIYQDLHRLRAQETNICSVLFAFWLSFFYKEMRQDETKPTAFPQEL